MLALLAVILWRLPAWIIDAELEHVSKGKIRLAQTAGTLWRGQGILEVGDSAMRSSEPWLALEWTSDPANLIRGALAWQVSAGNVPVSRIELNLQGWTIDRTRLHGPARFFLEHMFSGAGRFGLQGDIALASSGFRCTWQSRCDGQLELRWLDAASDLLPGKPFGDYRLTIDGSPGGLQLHWETLHGEIRVEGHGRWTTDGSAAFNGTMRGDPAVLQQLSSIGGPWLHASGEPGTWIVAAP